MRVFFNPKLTKPAAHKKLPVRFSNQYPQLNILDLPTNYQSRTATTFLLSCYQKETEYTLTVINTERVKKLINSPASREEWGNGIPRGRYGEYGGEANQQYTTWQELADGVSGLVQSEGVVLETWKESWDREAKQLHFRKTPTQVEISD